MPPRRARPENENTMSVGTLHSMPSSSHIAVTHQSSFITRFVRPHARPRGGREPCHHSSNAAPATAPRRSMLLGTVALAAPAPADGDASALSLRVTDPPVVAYD